MQGVETSSLTLQKIRSGKQVFRVCSGNLTGKQVFRVPFAESSGLAYLWAS
jgi:hypothetical protein